MRNGKANIVLLSTYPPNNARHGGQHRIKNVILALRADGHTVAACGISSDSSYEVNKGYLNFPGVDVLRRHFDDPALMEDFAIGNLMVKDKTYFNELATRINPKVDIIILAHPWLYEFATKYVALHKNRNIRIVYDSHNIECELKREIARIYFDENLAEKYYNYVLSKEAQALRGADLVISVSDGDAEWIRREMSLSVVIAKNGVKNRRPTYDDIRLGNEITQKKKFALYCASGHPPNIDGFFKMVSGGVGCFSPDQRLIVAGGAGSIIANDKRFNKISGLADIYINAGSVTESQLTGLLATSHAIILPLTGGGGTNLKTAEAIWAGKHIVATTKSMRGFEVFLQHKGVVIADEPVAFCNSIRNVLQASPLELSQSDRAERNSVLWSETLKPFVQSIANIVGAKND